VSNLSIEVKQSEPKVFHDIFYSTTLPNAYFRTSELWSKAKVEGALADSETKSRAFKTLEYGVVIGLRMNHIARACIAYELKEQRTIATLEPEFAPRVGQYLHWISKLAVQSAFITSVSTDVHGNIVILDGLQRQRYKCDAFVDGVPVQIRTGKGFSRVYRSEQYEGSWYPSDDSFRTLSNPPGKLIDNYYECQKITGVSPYLFLIDPRNITISAREIRLPYQIY